MNSDRNLPAHTIYALASGGTPSAIAVIRMSGPHTLKIVQSLCKKFPQKRILHYTLFVDPHSNNVLDDGLVVWFKGPNSVTGEDYAEFHIHGSSAIVDAFFSYFDTHKDVRQAQAGEFTRRAFDAGKMNLSQIEALQDLIEAETEIQRLQARRLMAGEFSQHVSLWRDEIITLRALVEADIDFSEDDELLPFYDELQMKLSQLQTKIAEQLALYNFGRRIREGANIVLMGRPNSGKSTLLNALAKQEAAIVSPIAGTTRDIVEVKLNIAGYPATLKDTAGIRQSSDVIEQEGVKRAKKEAEQADLILYLVEKCHQDKAKEMILEDISLLDLQHETDIIIVLSKSDMYESRYSKAVHISTPESLQIGSAPHVKTVTVVNVSVKHEELIRDLESQLHNRIKILCRQTNSMAVRSYHKKALELCNEQMQEILTNIHQIPSEIIAENLRACEFQLAYLIGYVDVEEVLGAIFSRFCIGK